MARGPALLLVNDDVAQLTLMGGLLKKDGFLVHPCSEARQALSMLENGLDIDLLITDLNMPDLPGEGLLEEIRSGRYPAYRQLPVILVSASSAESELRSRCLTLDGIILAPYRLKDVRTLAGQIAIGDNRTPPAPEPAEPAAPADLTLDREVLDRLRRAGGMALLDRVVGMFLERGPQKLDEARSAADARDFPLLERLVHSLKGSAGMIGAWRLQERCREVEHLACGRVEADFPALLEMLSVELAAVRGELEESL